MWSEGMYLAAVLERFNFRRPNNWIEQVEAMHGLKQQLIELQEPIQDIVRIVDNINKNVESKFVSTHPLAVHLGLVYLAGQILPD